MNKPTYVIGIDNYDPEIFTYCLAKNYNNTTEVLLIKRMKNKLDFKEEINNLSKYFNAIILKEK